MCIIYIVCAIRAASNLSIIVKTIVITISSSRSIIITIIIIMVIIIVIGIIFVAVILTIITVIVTFKSAPHPNSRLGADLRHRRRRRCSPGTPHLATDAVARGGTKVRAACGCGATPAQQSASSRPRLG